MKLAAKIYIKIVLHDMKDSPNDYFILCRSHLCKRRMSQHRCEGFHIFRRALKYEKRHWYVCNSMQRYNMVSTVTASVPMQPQPLGFSGDSDGKESACIAGDQGSITGLGRSPGEGNANPLQYSGKSHGQRSLERSQRFRHDWATNTHTYRIIAYRGSF